MSLDFIGKFVLIGIMITVAIGLMMGFQSDISSAFDGILGGGDEPKNVERVDVSSNPTQKIASLVDTCYQRYLENSYEDFVCFIATSSSGSVTVSGDDIEDNLNQDVADTTNFKNNYDSSTVIIRYSSSKGEIMVEE
jgi:hypothetical protein